MDLHTDRQLPTTGPAWIEPSRLWILGLTIGDDGEITGPAKAAMSWLDDCECPGPCNRDHERE
jgi:hypothetical protein